MSAGAAKAAGFRWAIWIWAWRKHHRATFQRMAALPMEDGAPDGEEHA